jgi:fluoride exporter
VELEANTEVGPVSTPRMRTPRRRAPRHLDRQELAAIFAGGCLGALTRGALAQSLLVGADAWPWATFAVNILGAALLGYFITRLQERLPPSLYGRGFLGTGLCGALSTFSTVMVELVRMIEGGQPMLAAGYAGASIAGGLTAIFVTTKLVRRARLTR